MQRVVVLVWAGLVAAQAAEKHFNLTIAMRLAMEYGQNCDALGQHCEPNFRAYERDGGLYYHNSSANTGDPGIEMAVPGDADMLLLDGFYQAVTAVNGQVPGPAIEVDEGDVVHVRVTNKLDNEATTIHFHGMFQRGTPWMDGVSQMTQCAILPGQTFTYRFIAEPPGTHFYHSHHGVQRPYGIFGALVVKPKQPRHVCEEVGSETMVLSVWQHLSSESLYVLRDGPGFYPDGPDKAPWVWSRDASGKLVGEIPMASGLINGRGRWNHNRMNLTVFHADLELGKCFRVVGTQEGKALRLSVDGHSLTVFASDGYPIDPLEVDSLIVLPGETFDLSVHPDPTSTRTTANKSFWVRADTLEVGLNHSALAILRYPHAPEADPVSSPRACTSLHRCTALNCPFPSFHPTQFTDCFSIGDTRDPAPAAIPATAAQPPPTFLNFGFEPSINNRRFVIGEAPPLTQPDDAHMVVCDPELCQASGFPKEPCTCTHYMSVGYNHTIQLVLTNLGISAFGMHPVHLHGHQFRVLKVGFPPVYEDTGAVCKWAAGAAHPSCKQTVDIVCTPGTGCSVAHWANQTPPVLNRDRPPIKNTVIVPPGGYTVIEFESTNPGWWHLHCHMAHHLASGMGMFLNEAPEEQKLFPPPGSFPRCGGMHGTQEFRQHVDRSTQRWQQLQAGS